LIFFKRIVLILPFGFIYALNLFQPATRTNNYLAIRYLSSIDVAKI